MLEAQRYKDTWQAAQRERVESGVAGNAFVYAHFRVGDDQLFYVGIGVKPTRPWQIYNRTNWHKNTVAKHGLRVGIIADKLTWDQATFWEIRWIKSLRASGYEIVNLTDGGDGVKGYKHTPQDIQNMSKIQKSRVESGVYIAPMNIPGVREKHLEATQSEEFKNKQRARMKTEGGILERPGARDAHRAAVNSEDFIEKQRARMLFDNPMFSENARANYYAAINSEEYKKNKLENALRGEDHYASKNPELGVRNGRRLQKSFTEESRSEAGRKSWMTRRENITAKGPDFIPAKSEKQVSSEKAGGNRLQAALTPEDRVINAKKGWNTRRKNGNDTSLKSKEERGEISRKMWVTRNRRYQYWGA